MPIAHPATRRLVAAALVTALVLVPACSDEKKSDKKSEKKSGKSATTTTSASSTPSSSTTSASSSTSAAPNSATTASTAPTSTSTTSASALPTSAENYSQGLVDAWIAGDRADADRYGTTAAVDTLFGLEPGGEEGAPAPTWTLAGCDGAAGSSYCTYTAGAGMGVVLRLVNELVSQGQTQAVVDVTVAG